MTTSRISSSATSQIVAVLAAITSVGVTVMAWREEEKDKKGKVQKSPFSKQVGVVLERENQFILERKEGNPKLLRE